MARPGQEIFQSPFFPLQANELAPINEKIPIQFHQMKTHVLLQRSLFTKPQRLQLLTATHYFVLVTAVVT